MTRPGLRRRDLLRGAGALLAGARLPAAAPLVACGDGAGGAGEVARGYFAGDACGSAAAIGRAYRASLEEAGLSVDADLAPLIDAIDGWRAAAIDELALAVAAEFRAADVVRLEGWTFAPTELRLAALVSLG